MGMYAVETAETGELAALRAVAYEGRAVAIARRRALAAGRSALGPEHDRVRTGLREAQLRTPSAAADETPAAGNGSDPDGGAPRAPAAPPAPDPATVPTNSVASAHFGRAMSIKRRRQMSQGKQALSTDGVAPGAPGAPGAPAATASAAETPKAEEAGSCREQARARRADASRFGRGAISRPAREGRVTYAPKVMESPTHLGQQVTGLRIGPGVRVTGDEAGAALPVSGTQYVAADGSSPAPGAGPKVGLVRTPRGLVVSGTTVRNKVSITGDEAGEHLTITGEADQKFDDDMTPRPDGAYRSAQFPRRADPHGATALGTRLGVQSSMAASGQNGPWHPLENTDGGLAVTGTAVGRSGRVTGNEAGACRPITGDQYQDLSSYSSECGGTGGGTAPAAHLNRSRMDPVTGGKVTVAQTWGGQRVTGPSVEHRPGVTGDEPGVCRPVTGTPYQGPSTAFGWCEPGEGESVAQRNDSRPEGVAVTGNVPMHAKAVTGTERGRGSAVTGTPYYAELRPAEPAADDWDGRQAFPVALARRMAVAPDENEPDEPGDTQSTGDAPPASSAPGRITGSFAVGDGKVTGNKEFLFRARPSRATKQSVVTGEGRTEGRTVTGSAWTSHDRVTGTEGYIAAGRNPSEGGGGTHGWAGAGRFRDKATPDRPRQNVTGLSGWSPEAAARVTLSGGAQG